MPVPFPSKAAFLLLSIPLISSAQAQRITRFSLEPVTGSPAGRRLASITAVMPAGDHVVEDSPDTVTWHPVSPVLRPGVGTMNWSHKQYDATGPYGTSSIYQSGSTNWGNRRFYRVRQLAPANAAPAITGAPVATFGRLTQPTAKGAYRVITKGNWTIRMLGTSIIMTSPSGRDKVEIWGDGSGGTGHENLNGKHIKDNAGGARTLLLPDGTIVTVGLSTEPGKNTIARFSIYDGDQSHRLTTTPDANGNPNTVVMSVGLTRAGEADEADGETGRLLDTPNGAFLENLYTQSAANGQPVVQESVPLGLTGGPANPDFVVDYYDDPRLGAT